MYGDKLTRLTTEIICIYKNIRFIMLYSAEKRQGCNLTASQNKKHKTDILLFGFGYLRERWDHEEVSF